MAEGQGAARSRALEIGCGLGLAGLVAMARGMRVQFSDYDRTPLEFVARSAAENRFDGDRFMTRLLDWRNLPDERFPVILGADVIYEVRLVPLVAGVLAAMLAPGGVGLIASPYRVAAEAFPAVVGSHGLACQAQPATATTEDGRPVAGTIYRVTRSAVSGLPGLRGLAAEARVDVQLTSGCDLDRATVGADLAVTREVEHRP